MKVKLTFKSPDVMEQVDEEVQDSPVFEKFIKYSEYIYVEFDTENNTAVVLPV